MSILAFAGVVAMRAADDRAKKDRRDDDTLKKYDKNANGKLDPDEDAALKADQAKAEKKKKG